MASPTTVQIQIERQVAQDRLNQLGVSQWPIWTKEVSEFPWTYGEQETCYILDGEVIVTPENGEAVQFSQGDLVIFPSGLSCTWKIVKPVRKHYQFG